jgi:hypothetical protein
LKENQDISSFDSWVKSSLQNANVNPPSGLWQGIESGIGTSSAGSGGLIDQIRSIVQQLGWKASAGIAGMAAAGGFLYYSMVSNSPEQKASNTETATQAEPLADQENFPDQSETKAEWGENSISVQPSTKQDANQPETSQNKTDKPLRSSSSEPVSSTAQPKNADEIPPSDEVNSPPTEAKPIAPTDNAAEPIDFEIKATTYTYCDRIAMEITLEPPVRATWYSRGKTKPFARAKDLALEIVWENEEGSDSVATLTAEYEGVRKTIKFNRERLSDFSWENATGDNIQFNVQGQQPEMMWWDYGDGSDVEMSSESAVSHYFNYQEEPYQVMMIARYNDGCIDTIRHRVSPPKTDTQYEPFIPNVFTPYSKDGKNDVFKVEIKETTYYHLVIQNTQGEVVFESRNPAEAWNGKYKNQGEMCGKGKYVYTLRYAVKEQRIQVRQDILTIR